MFGCWQQINCMVCIIVVWSLTFWVGDSVCSVVSRISNGFVHVRQNSVCWIYIWDVTLVTFIIRISRSHVIVLSLFTFCSRLIWTEWRHTFGSSKGDNHVKPRQSTVNLPVFTCKWWHTGSRKFGFSALFMYLYWVKQ